MSENAPPEVSPEVPASGLARLSDLFEASIRPVYTWLGYLGAAVLGALILVVVYSIIGRQFGAGLLGSQEIIEQSFVIIVFAVMGLEHMDPEKMTVDVLVRKLPARCQQILAPIIYVIAVAILVVAVWQLVAWGMRAGDRGSTTMGALSLPIAPFVYVSAFGIATLIPLYLIRLMRSIDAAVRR